MVRIDVDHIDYNDNSDPDAIQIDYGDKKVLDAIGTGKCEGVFQLESAGMKNFMKELKPQVSGGCYRRNLSVPSGTDGFHSKVH